MTYRNHYIGSGSGEGRTAIRNATPRLMGGRRTIPNGSVCNKLPIAIIKPRAEDPFRGFMGPLHGGGWDQANLISLHLAHLLPWPTHPAFVPSPHLPVPASRSLTSLICLTLIHSRASRFFCSFTCLPCLPHLPMFFHLSNRPFVSRWYDDMGHARDDKKN